MTSKIKERLMNQHEQLDYLIDYLLNEQPDNQSFFNDYQRDTLDDKFELFRGLCNVRAPQPISDDFLNIQDDFLTHWNQDRPLVSLQDLTAIQPQLYLLQEIGRAHVCTPVTIRSRMPSSA